MKIAARRCFPALVFLGGVRHQKAHRATSWLDDANQLEFIIQAGSSRNFLHFPTLIRIKGNFALLVAELRRACGTSFGTHFHELDSFKDTRRQGKGRHSNGFQRSLPCWAFADPGVLRNQKRGHQSYLYGPYT